jgi:uncharacterized membrane protein
MSSGGLLPRRQKKHGLVRGDEQIEKLTSVVLRSGVVIAATIVLFGGIFYLIRYGMLSPNYHFFHGEPADLRSVSGIIKGALSFHPRNIIQLGLLVLIATPVARVLLSVFAFAVERDRAYVIITLIVLGVLLFSLAGGGL